MRPSRSFAALVLLALIAPAHWATAETGIAAAYPGDIGIEEDPRVILFEGFERGTVGELVARWGDARNSDGMSFVEDVPPLSLGRRSLQITSEGGVNTGGHVYTQLSSLQERTYLRYYVKYTSEGSYRHSGAWIGGYNPPTPWPQGGAGKRPEGNEGFTIGFEPRDPQLRLDFYNYWMGMRAAPDGKYWGNILIQDAALRAQSDRWTCIEIMVVMNDPVDTTNGELAVWVDGERVAYFGPGFPTGSWNYGRFTPDPDGEPFEGFQWRSDPALALNFVWLKHFTTADSQGVTGRVLFDQVVAASQYIGPISGGGAQAPPQAPILLPPR